MAVTFDFKSNPAAGVSVSSLTFAHTCSGTKRYLVVGVMTGGAPQTPTSVTFAGIAMTRLGGIDNGSGTAARQELYGLVNPPVTTDNIIVTLSVASTNLLCAGVSFNGVDQANPTRAFVADVTTTINIVDSVLGDMVIDAAGSDVFSTVDPSQVEVWNVGQTWASGGSIKPGAVGSVAMTWTNFTFPRHVGFALKAATTGNAYPRGFPQRISGLRARAGAQPSASSAYAADQGQPPPPVNVHPWPQPVPGIPVTGPQPLARIVWFETAQELNLSWRPWPQPVPPKAIAGAQPASITWLAYLGALFDFAFRGPGPQPVPPKAVAGDQPLARIAWFLQESQFDFSFRAWPQPIPPVATAGAQPPNISWLAFLGGLFNFAFKGPGPQPVPPAATAGAQPLAQIVWFATAQALHFSWRPWPQPIPPVATAGAQPPNLTSTPWSQQPLPTFFVPLVTPQPVPGLPVSGPQPFTRTMWVTEAIYADMPWRGLVPPPPGAPIQPTGPQPLAHIVWFAVAQDLNFSWRPWFQPVPGIPVTGPQFLSRIAWVPAESRFDFSFRAWLQPVPPAATAGAQPPVITWSSASSFVPDLPWKGPGPQPVPPAATAGAQPLARIAWFLETFVFNLIVRRGPQPVPDVPTAGPQPLWKLGVSWLTDFPWLGLHAPKPPDPAVAGPQPLASPAAPNKGAPVLVNFSFRPWPQPVPPAATAGTQPYVGATTIKERFKRFLVSVTRYFAREDALIHRGERPREAVVTRLESRSFSRRSYSVRIASVTNYRRVPGVEDSVSASFSQPRVLSNNIWQHALTDNLSGGVVSGATLHLTVTDPNSSVVINNVVVPEVGTTGVYRYESAGAACQIAGIYTATWTGTDATGKDIHRVDLVQVTLS